MLKTILQADKSDAEQRESYAMVISSGEKRIRWKFSFGQVTVKGNPIPNLHRSIVGKKQTVSLALLQVDTLFTLWRVSCDQPELKKIPFIKLEYHSAFWQTGSQ